MRVDRAHVAFEVGDEDLDYICYATPQLGQVDLVLGDSKAVLLVGMSLAAARETVAVLEEAIAVAEERNADQRSDTGAEGSGRPGDAAQDRERVPGGEG